MRIRLRLIYFISAISLPSCSNKDEVKPNQAPVAEIRITQEAGKVNLDGSFSHDPEAATLAYKWTTSSSNIIIASPYFQKTFFLIPAVTVSQEVTITLQVSDGSLTHQSTKTVRIDPIVNKIQSYGLGDALSQEWANDRNYDWYLDQGNSGSFANVNCGPASVTMAIKWSMNNFSGTALDARQKYRPSGGWWYTDDIIRYLNDYYIPNRIIALSDMDKLKTEIDKGNVVMLCLDMFYVDYQPVDTFHHGKFYSTNGTGWGHFIVIKGYKVVDGIVYYEAYDPYSFGRVYSDNSLKGKDRYYTSSNLDRATGIWWDYAIVVSKANGRMTDQDEVDPDTIIHKPGRGW